MCKGSETHQRFFSNLVVLVSVARQCGIVLEPCLQRVILTDIRIPHVVSWCATHLIAYICSKRLRRYLWWWDWQTVVDSGGTRAPWSGRAVGIQGYETKEEHPLTRGGASFIGQALWGPKTVLKGTPPRRAEKLNFDKRIATNTVPGKLHKFWNGEGCVFPDRSTDEGQASSAFEGNTERSWQERHPTVHSSRNWCRGGTSKSRVFDKSVGGPKVKLRRVAPRRSRSEEDDIMVPII